MRRPVLVAVLAVLAALLVGATPAAAESKTVGAADLSVPADGGYGCETRFIPGFAPGSEDEAFRFPGSTCTSFSGTRDISASPFVPGSGTITKVRVKSGPDPAPIRVSIIRQTVRPTKASSDITDQCCLGRAETPTVNPTPNAVTEIPVNLPVEVQLPQDTIAGWHDIVAISGVGPGTMPIASTGPHTAAAAQAPETPNIISYYGHITPGANRNNGEQWYATNWRLLMQYDWTSAAAACPGARRGTATARQACGGATGGGGTTGGGGGTTGGGGTPATKPRAKVRSTALRLSRGKRVAVSVGCSRGDGKRCVGRVRLRTDAKKPRLLASRALKVEDGRSAKVVLTLGRTARKRVRKASTKVAVEIDLGKGQPKIRRKLVLKR